MHTLQRRFFVEFLRFAPEKSKFWEDRGRGYPEEGGGGGTIRAYIYLPDHHHRPHRVKEKKRGGVVDLTEGKKSGAE